MKHFSVARDEKKLIPYILAAQKQMGSGDGWRKTGYAPGGLVAVH
eukprot:COSAG06_NODE_405_length_16132_cov_9.166532_13_plen_45_part_00